ncbi:protein FAM169B isoform X3 [Mustela putorius furo]|uniref:Protein FAM169B isoform X3 n=1 Tax=Mustela putorius furo TaxID=9669 RepID=A0A8U0RNL7_MUSPF|nr:protein FAM169B isoform X3 [Mustela putorius furo]
MGQPPGRGAAPPESSMEAEAARRAAGVYPVDILEDDPERHREAALAYYATLREGMQPSEELFSLPTGEQVKLKASSVCFCTVHRDEPQHKILVLVNPQDTKTVVAVYIKESWWPTEDVLRTSDPAREGLLKVQSFGERIVLFILNVVIFGRLERNLDDRDMFFLPHSVKEQAKILWRDGSAVGFYTTKRKGSLCGDGTGACYLLPVFDTVFVRRMYRRQGLGMAMLQDFCETFREDEALGVSWPISPAMYQAHPGDANDDMSSQGQTTPDEGPGHSEEGKKERTPGEREERKSDQDCGVEETAAGWLGGACGAQPAGKEAKRTAVEAGLAWESQQKHLRPSS